MTTKTAVVLTVTVCASGLIFSSVAHATFSIVAHDPQTKEWGVAVASREVAVGAAVPWARAGAGAVATQAFISPEFGRDGLMMMESGFTAEQTLKLLLDRDDLVDARQVALVDAAGNVAVFTGGTLSDYVGHRKGEHYSVQGNVLAGERVLIEMERAFLETEGPLAIRLLEALRAGDAAGGDRRGRQSAAIRVVRDKSDFRKVTDCMIDLRVDNDPEAVQALAETFEQWAFRITLYFYLGSEIPADFERGEALLDWILAREEAKTEPDIYSYYTITQTLAAEGWLPERNIEISLRATERFPGSGGIMDSVADAYYAVGNTEEAVRWTRMALEIQPASKHLSSQLERYSTGAP